MSKFTVSPPGIGWDCYRTWEAVLFGSIPIVIGSPAYSQLYRDSPVMVVDDWTEVTVDRLVNYRVKNTSKDVVMVDHWLDRFREVADQWRYKTN